MDTTSERSKVFARPEFLLHKLHLCAQDQFCPERNPGGYLNFGVAHNHNCEDDVIDWINDPERFKGLLTYRKEWMAYTDMHGHDSVRQTTADFFSKYFAGSLPIDKDHIRLCKGITVALEALGFILFDPGDIVITPTPTYPRFFADFKERADVTVVPFHLSSTDDYRLRPDALDQLVRDLKGQGLRVKGFLYCNPSNPLGDIYPPEVTLELMEVCKKHGLHFISDEAYALSIFEDGALDDFKSVLSWQEGDIPDPERTHVLWTMSKDFGAAGLRFGVVHSRNQLVLQALEGMRLYSGVPAVQQEVGAALLKDWPWLDQHFLPKTRAKLKVDLSRAKHFLESRGATVRMAKATLFLWVNLRKFMRGDSFEDEAEAFERLFGTNKIYIVPGNTLRSSEPGWFRINPAVPDWVFKEFQTRFDAFVVHSKRIIPDS